MTNSSICCTSAAPSGHFYIFRRPYTRLAPRPVLPGALAASFFSETPHPARPAFSPARRSCCLFFRRPYTRLAPRSVLPGAFAGCFFGDPAPARLAFSPARRSCCLFFRRPYTRLAPRSVLSGAFAGCFFGEPAPGSPRNSSYICFAVLPRYYL